MLSSHGYCPFCVQAVQETQPDMYQKHACALESWLLFYFWQLGRAFPAPSCAQQLFPSCTPGTGCSSLLNTPDTVLDPLPAASPFRILSSAPSPILSLPLLLPPYRIPEAVEAREGAVELEGGCTWSLLSAPPPCAPLLLPSVALYGD
ncbi:mitogen-activated protein kinase kinase kinase 8 [Platysternon megacephalum]|uniref:Mitogen-activated protein kinase kinase kinase 8 n=1 Tax=Platysternon megacephalum TaxID=55544 RepID=A0A4D9ET14_9SAUR|nr:mitogen-activated protein kinase kinase kinase 8 [Platysternon megacephalum]